MSTDPSVTHLEIPNEIHAKVKTLSVHTGIKMKRITEQLMSAGLRSKFVDEQIECGILAGHPGKGNGPDEQAAPSVQSG